MGAALKTVHFAIIGGAAIAAIGIILAFYANSFQTIGAKSYSSGDFTVYVLEDTSSRFLAKVENKGPALDNAAAFVVRKGLDENCEPQGIVVANFRVNDTGGRLVPNPDSLPANSQVTLDSRNVNLSTVPTGPGFETTVYILGLEENSITAKNLIQKVPISQPDSTELESFESCLEQAGKGYPLELKVSNPQKDTRVFFAIKDTSDKEYQTGLSIGTDVPDAAFLFWPNAASGWLSGNYTQFSGPAPAWKEQEQVMVSVTTVSGGEVDTFEDTVAPRLVTASYDFVDVAKGLPLPAHPKYWEIDVDLAGKTVG